MSDENTNMITLTEKIPTGFLLSSRVKINEGNLRLFIAFFCLLITHHSALITSTEFTRMCP
jgi:hypothetical protein